MIASVPCARADVVKGDNWLTDAAGVSSWLVAHPSDVRSNAFSDLKAEFIAGRVKVTWTGEDVGKDSLVYLVSSEEAPGHWAARDWRPEEMTRLSTGFEKVIKVEDLDVPQLYFVKVVQGTTAWESPMRVFQPRQAGMDMPTRLFWPFLEGFEEGLDHWKILSRAAEGNVLRTNGAAKSGMASLQVVLGPKQRPVTVGTTRLRGWQIVKQRATGVRVWLRTASGKGRVRFTLHANAFTPEQAISVAPGEIALNDHWQQVDLLFAQFPPLPLGAVDFFSLEFSGEGAREFQIDNVGLLGPWKAEE
ncbi:MAG: hypothetical protein JWM16_894 [Verrucomicrobiales bacterium]|nr:hypothetical protein [Verrucomicrobiales bacterium]